MPYDLNIVLVEPEIPFNTGSIGRTCLATGSKLHLIEPLGFEITNAQLKRGGLDYWHHLDVSRYENLYKLMTSIPANSKKVYFSTKAKTPYYECEFKPETYFIFGKETKGLPEDLLHENWDQCYNIPIFDERVRSLNLANAVGIVLYEAIRQLGEVKKLS
jgi:tRNA (cytidine/uridine-2'-O-)-methyltransferase